MKPSQLNFGEVKLKAAYPTLERPVENSSLCVDAERCLTWLSFPIYTN
jgi:hypothetical protein